MSDDQALRHLIDRVLTARDTRTPLCLRGHGSKDFYGETPRGEPLDLTPLAGISHYEPTELVVTARAGTPLAELEAVPTGISAKRLLDAGAVLSMCHAAASSASSEQAEHRSPRLAAAAPEAQKRAGDRNDRGEGKRSPGRVEGLPPDPQCLPLGTAGR